jgi:hypothetical protein
MNLIQDKYKLPGNRPAFVFSDPAGTNACISMYRLLEQFYTQAPLLYSNRSYYPSLFETIVKKEIPDFDTLKIDCLFTGTSHPESSDFFEVNCIKCAKRRGIYTISFIDHWINFKLRFEGLTIDELPDQIWVVDNYAKKLAINEGLPPEKLVINENPHLYYLKAFWKTNYTGKDYFRELEIPLNGFHLLYAPDPFSIRGKSSQVGFSEAQALDTIIKIIPHLKTNVYLIICAHPLQPLDVFEEVVARYDRLRFKIVKNVDKTELIYASDLVLGFHSNLLLEAKAMGKSVVRYFPGNLEADLLRNNKDFTEVCLTQEELKNQILQYL